MCARRGDSHYKILILKLWSSVINFNHMVHRIQCMHWSVCACTCARACACVHVCACVCVNEEASELWILVQRLCPQNLQQWLAHSRHLMSIKWNWITKIFFFFFLVKDLNNLQKDYLWVILSFSFCWREVTGSVHIQWVHCLETKNVFLFASYVVEQSFLKLASGEWSKRETFGTRTL